MTHEEEIIYVFERACKVLKLTGFQIRPMQRRGPVNTNKTFTQGYIDLRTKIITIDVFTPRRRQPKSINSILRILAHELAHFQKMPYQQRFRGRVIVRQHYPAFYNQVNRNIKKFQKDTYLQAYFTGKPGSSRKIIKRKKKKSILQKILRHI